MLSIILPSRNEPNASKMMEELEATYNNVQLIVSNDADGRGKGFAIRQAFAHATGEYVCFLDADGDISPKMIKRLIPYIVDYDIVVGVKPISGRWDRRILTFLSRYYIAILFNIKVDTQTGIKLFRRYAIQEFYNDGFLFDLEILSVAKKRGMKLIEVPIEATVNKGMKLTSIWRTFKESITLWLELR